MKSEKKAMRFLVLGANTPWVYALAEALAQTYTTTAIRVYDWRTYYRDQVRWPNGGAPAGMARRTWLFPPGHLGAFRAFFSRIMAVRLRNALTKAPEPTPQSPWLIAPYPWLAPPELPVQVPNLIYYNLDDYTLYRPERAAQTLSQEERTIGCSRLVICLAQEQVRRFQSRPGARGEAIRHFPLGVASELLAPRSGMEAEPGTVGYVGNLGDRVDWQLVVAVAKSLPAVRFDFAGRTDDVGQSGQRPDWLRWRSEAFQLPNVRRHPTVPQHQVGSYYWRTALNWIPYDVGHPFNVASCPTKIMDGLASGRPVLSTAVPECLLYPDHISVFRSAGEAKRLIEQSLQTVARGDWRNRQVAQLEFVRQHLWPKRAALLADWLQSLLGE